MSTNLPIAIDSRHELIEQKRNTYRIKDNIKRVLKNSGNFLTVAGSEILAGLAAIAIPAAAPVFTTIATGAMVVAATRGIYYSIYKKEKDTMFMTRRKINGVRGIYQDSLDLRGLNIMKDFQPSQKAALMGLQMLVGLQRFKQEYADRGIKSEPARNKEGIVYNKSFSTVTHGVNVKTFEALEELGYIQIDSLEDKGPTLIIAERIGFGQFKEAKDALKSIFTGDKEQRKELQRQKTEIKFRLTDKQLNLEQIYEQYINDGRKADKNIRRIGIMLRSLKEKNIDVKTDELGIPKIDYKASQSIADRIEQQMKEKSNEKRFREELKESGIQNDKTKELLEVQRDRDNKQQKDQNGDER